MKNKESLLVTLSVGELRYLISEEVTNCLKTTPKEKKLESKEKPDEP